MTSYGLDAAGALRGAVADGKAATSSRPVTVVSVEPPRRGVTAAAVGRLARAGRRYGVGRGRGHVPHHLPVGRLRGHAGRKRATAGSTRCWPRRCAPEPVRPAGLFAPVASTAATEAALVSTYRELRDLSRRPRGAGRIEPDRRRRSCACMATAGSTRAVVVRRGRPPCSRPRRGGHARDRRLGALVVYLPSGSPSTAQRGSRPWRSTSPPRWFRGRRR